MTDRAVSFEHLLRLAHQRALDGKGGLAASVAKLCLDSRSDLSERELSLTFEILRMLIDKVEVAVRRNISDYLCDRTDVPKDLIAFLANDTVHVAYPILRSSPLLTDYDLIRLIDDHGHGHAMAVAARDDLTGAVSHRLIAMQDDAVDLTLAKNLTATIDPTDMEALVERAVDRTALHTPLASRGDLGADLARRLYTLVGDALRRHIMDNYDIDGAVVAEAVDNAVLDSLDAPNPLDAAVGSGWTQQIQRGGHRPAARLLRRLLSDGIEGAAIEFSEHTHLPLETARWVFERGDGQTLAVAVKSVGMDVDGYTTLLDRMKRISEDEDIERLSAYFERIDMKTAAMVVSHWKTRPPRAE
ncbi:MAG: DUF2336 domain-containing protein [Alphaproteobacteria bacterium]|nr:DUF2336 domain-containing protein [Alphaproteobacteria bacterium]